MVLNIWKFQSLSTLLSVCLYVCLSLKLLNPDLVNTSWFLSRTRCCSFLQYCIDCVYIRDNPIFLYFINMVVTYSVHFIFVKCLVEYKIPDEFYKLQILQKKIVSLRILFFFVTLNNEATTVNAITHFLKNIFLEKKTPLTVILSQPFLSKYLSEKKIMTCTKIKSTLRKENEQKMVIIFLIVFSNMLLMFFTEIGTRNN